MGKNYNFAGIFNTDDTKLEELLETLSINLNDINDSGKSPLMFYTEKGDLKNMELLLKYGANPNFCAPNGDSALLYAVKNNNPEVIQLLLDYGANMDDKVFQEVLKDSQNWMLFFGQFAINENYLKNKKVKSFISDKNNVVLYGKTLVKKLEQDSFTRYEQKLGEVKAILQKRKVSKEETEYLKVELGILRKILVDKNRDNAMIEAVKRARLQQVKALLNSGVDVNLQDNSGATLLGLAVREVKPEIQERKIEVMEELVARGADLNKPNLRGWTPMHQAAAYGNISATEFLKAKDAKLEEKDESGRTPLDLAKINKHKGVQELLEPKTHDLGDSGELDLMDLIVPTHFRERQTVVQEEQISAIAQVQPKPQSSIPIRRNFNSKGLTARGAAQISARNYTTARAMGANSRKKQTKAPILPSVIPVIAQSRKRPDAPNAVVQEKRLRTTRTNY